MGQGIFITGTDTGVGKTFFACGLAALLKASGYRVGVMKPVETGCDRGDGKLTPQDALALKEASGCQMPLENICPYQLREPLAPGVAAEREDTRIDIDRLMVIYNEIRATHDVTLVEGAGGLLVPLLPSYTFADFACVLKIPIIVIAANRLGVINHLLLTLEHASCRGLRVLGYVLNQLEAQLSVAAETNRETLFTMTAVPCAAELPYLEDRVVPIELFEDRLDFRIMEPVLNHL
jgi:dethiobiotin synthetase